MRRLQIQVARKWSATRPTTRILPKPRPIHTLIPSSNESGIIRFAGETRVVPRIRQARPDEAGLLTEVAMRLKAHWGYDAAFMANVRADLEVVPEKFMPGF